jgi:hypothetical protein
MGPLPPGYPQAPWPQQNVPPQKGNNLNWLLAAIAVLLVIGVTIGATLLFTRGGGNTSPTPSTSDAVDDIASANDTGPVSIITEEPTCKTFNGLNNGLADLEAKGWGAQRSSLGPAAEWTPEQRSQVQTMAAALRNAADQAVALAKQTPHRLVRELYEQFIAFGRAYADSVSTYTPQDNELATTNVAASDALLGICDSIDYGSTGRSVAIDPAGPPTGLAPLRDPEDPQPFVTGSSKNCTDWVHRLDLFNSSTVEWQKRDGSVPASQWTPEQRAVVEATQPLLTEYASDIESLGRQSDNPAFEDFAVTAALYIRTFASVGENYEVGDGWLSFAGFRIANLVSSACRAAAG